MLSGYPHVLSDVSASDTAYWALLSEWWRSDESEVIIIEHDISVAVDGIREFLVCPHPWCAAWYSFELGEIFGLGFTKFGLPIRRAVPGALDEVGVIDQSPVHPPRHWCSMDAWLQGVLRGHGFEPHLHRPAFIRHYGRVRSHVACR